MIRNHKLYRSLDGMAKKTRLLSRLVKNQDLKETFKEGFWIVTCNVYRRREVKLKQTMDREELGVFWSLWYLVTNDENKSTRDFQQVFLAFPHVFR